MTGLLVILFFCISAAIGCVWYMIKLEGKP